MEQQNMKAVEWLVYELERCGYFEINDRFPITFEQAVKIEKERMVKFAEFVSKYPDKNKNYQGEMLHAKSKYDEAERTIDLLEQYYNETCETKNK